MELRPKTAVLCEGWIIPKLKVAGSSPVSRSPISPGFAGAFSFRAYDTPTLNTPLTLNAYPQRPPLIDFSSPSTAACFAEAWMPA